MSFIKAESKMQDREKIKKEGIGLIETFSKMLENIEETDETHYVTDLKNITREDGKAIIKPGFTEKLKKIAPHWEEGYVVAEKAGN